MADNGCPTPTKRCRVGLFSFDSDGNDELNLSAAFEQTYQTLMNDEMMEICLKQYGCSENLSKKNNLSEFMRKCEEIQVLINAVGSKSNKEPLCRSDFYLTKIQRGKQLLQSSKFTSMKMLGKRLLFVEPELTSIVMNKFDELEKQCDLYGVITSNLLPPVLGEVKKDIDDLSLWLDDVTKKLNFDISSSNNTMNVDFIKFIMKDFEVHNEISLSVIRLTNELEGLKVLSLHKDSLGMVRSAMDSLEGALHQLWLRAFEYQLILEDQAKCGSMINIFGSEVVTNESGFESELSARNYSRKVPEKNCEHSTDLLSESESAAISVISSDPSTSTLYSSTESLLENMNETLSSPRKTIRRKKRRSRRQGLVNQYDISTEESETCGNNAVTGLLKRRFAVMSNLQWPDNFQPSPQGLSYSEIADNADNLVRNVPGHEEHYSYQCPQESELEEIIATPKSSLNEINVEKTWDYYQAPMYSNEEGDSQLIEIDDINDWEPETDVSDILLMMNGPSEICHKKLSMMTSGYETSIESDPSTCSKSLICVLQFTNIYCQDVERKMTGIENMDPCNPEEVLAALKECQSTAQTHLKLIHQILYYGPCTFTHNETLINNLSILDKTWTHIKDKCICSQLRVFENQIRSLEGYRNVDELQSSIKMLKKITGIFENFKNINLSLEVKDKVWVNIDRFDEGLSHMKISKTKQLELIHQCLTCVTQCKCERKLLECELWLSKPESLGSSINIQGKYGKFEQGILSLRTCMDNVASITSTECRAQISNKVEKEISLWKTMCKRTQHSCPLSVLRCNDQVDNLREGPTTESPSSVRSTLFRHLSVHMAVVAVVLILGWWYNQASRGDCHSSSRDWIQILYRFRDHLEPH